MKTIVTVTTLALSLAACSASGTAPTSGAASDSSKIEQVNTANAAAADRSGDYEMTDADGTKWHTTIGKDGTYAAIYEDGKHENGTVKTANGLACFDMDGNGKPRCWKLSDPSAMGHFTATDQRGDTVSVVKSGS